MTSLEHTLVILLLLVGLLNANPKIPGFAWWVIAVALALVLVAPTASIILPWAWLSAIIIPILLWQTFQRLVEAQMPVRIRDWLIWSGMILGISGILLVTSELTGAGSFVFGLLAASMIWRAVEADRQPTYLGQLGPLALAFLLAEIAPAVEALGRYMIALLTGAAIGALLGYSAVHASQRSSQSTWQTMVSIGQAYLAYGVATYFELSGVAAAMMSVAVYVAYGTKCGLWSKGSIHPRPLDSVPVFGLAVLALTFFAWQTHTPVTLSLLLEIGLGLALTALLVWVGRRLRIESFLIEDSYARTTLRVAFLLVPSLLIWPRETLLNPLPLAIALLIAALATIGTRYTISPLLKLYEWIDEAGVDFENRDMLMNTLLVRDLMARDCITIPPTMPVPEIARIFAENRAECVPVTDDEKRLLGIVTEHDLFVKEERLPRAGITYMAVFSEPVVPEILPEVYAKRGAANTAADVMTSKVVWVKETSDIGHAVRLMVLHGFKCLPVLSNAPVAGGKLVGILTRSNIVRLLTQVEQSSIHPPSE
jgi:CBS domain-containing protein